MSINLSTYMIILFLITIVLSPTISSSVSASPSTTINNSSTYPISNSSSFTSLVTEKEKNNLTSPTTFEITDNLKALIKDKIDSNKSNAAMAIGLIDPNGTQSWGYGKLSNASNNATIDENTVF